MHDNDTLSCLVIDTQDSRLIVEKEYVHSDSGSIIDFKLVKDPASISEKPLSELRFHACVLICDKSECRRLSHLVKSIFKGLPVACVVRAKDYSDYKQEAESCVDVMLLAETLTEDELARTIVYISKLDRYKPENQPKPADRKYNGAATGTPEVVLYPQSIYRRIVESSPNMVCRTLPDAMLIFVNNTFSEFFGHPKESLIGMTLSQLIPQESSEAIIRAYGRLTPSHRKEVLVQKIASVRKKTIWLELTCSGDLDESGNLAEVQIIGKDITKEHLWADIISHQQDQFRTLFQESNAGIVFISTDFGIEKANPAFCRIFGYDEMEIKGKKLNDIIFEKTDDGGKRPIPTRLDLIYDEKSIRIGKDGREIPVSLSLIPFKDGDRITGLCIIYRDLTVYKQKEEAMSISKTVIENSPVIIFKWRAEKGWPVEYVSQNVSSLGFTPEEMTTPGWEFLSIIHPDDRQRIEEITERYLEQGKTFFEYEYRAILKNGDIKWFLENTTPEFDEDGRLIRFTGIIMDDTRRMQAQMELEKSHEELKQSFTQTIEALAETVVTRDPYTASHQKRVALLSVAVGRKLGLDEDKCEGLYLAAIVHDIGKISVPAEILSKPTKLSDIEMKLIRIHPEKGYDILKGIKAPWPLADIVYQHHERIDGSGYPRGLSGKDTLIEARIIAVADIVEACASHRPYRPALGLGEALRIIKEARGTTLDANVVDACVAVFEEDGFILQTEE